MRTKIIPLVMLLLLSLSLVPVFAGPTELNLSWDGSGSISTTFTSDDDAEAGFATGGDYIVGTYHAKDFDDNPYNYQVDTTLSEFTGYVENGWIGTGLMRMDSCESMYGPADQWTSSYLSVEGEGELTFRTRSNFADMDSSNYGFQSDDHFLADGLYYAEHEVWNGLNHAWFEANGAGTLDIDHMSDDTWTTSIAFGKGCGCYTNADVTQTGVGSFELGAHFEGGMSLPNGGGSVSGPCDYLFQISFGSGFAWNNYSFNGW